MIRRLLLAFVVLGGAVGHARAQTPFGGDHLPTRTALARVGLERQWAAHVPLSSAEKVLALSISGDMTFAQTNLAFFHAFDSESGRLLWTANLGRQTGTAQPASVNSYAVFVTNANLLFSLDRRTGRTVWTERLEYVPTTPTACDEEQVIVGLSTGKVAAYLGKLQKIKIALPNGYREELKTTTSMVWNWQTNGSVTARPLPAGPVTAFGSADGNVYVTLSDSRKMVYRFATGGGIVAPFGTYGTRTLLVPSEDKNLYALDLWAATAAWVFASGAPIEQEPLVAEDDVYVVNKAGILSAVDARTGSARWSTSTHGGRLSAVSPSRLYLESRDDDLFIVDRATGRILADPRATFARAGLNLRPFELGPTNFLNDRVYLGTPSGLIVCLREIGQVAPRPLRDPKAPPLGFIPNEGIKVGPDGTAYLPGQEAKLKAEKAAAEEKKEAEPGEEKEKEKDDKEEK